MVIGWLSIVVYVTFFTQAACQQGSTVIVDTSTDEWTIETDRIPKLANGFTIDSRIMPTVGNGHLATQVYSDTIYINGLYNGAGGESHRARIPNEMAFRVNLSEYSKTPVPRAFKLDLKNGVFEERIPKESSKIIVRTYAHRFFTRLFVTSVTLRRDETSTGSNQIGLTTLRGADSKDIWFEQKIPYRQGNWYQLGRTVTAETPDTNTQEVHCYFTKILNALYLRPEDNEYTQVFLMSIDQNQHMAQQSFDEASDMVKTKEGRNRFFELHKEAWQKLWKQGRIELSGDDNTVSKIINAGMYYLLSSLPSLDHESSKMLNEFYGLSPGGLSRGGNVDGKGTDYLGHVFWDQETWMLPPVLMFHPLLAKSMLNYRVNKLNAAYEYARNTGYVGLRYPWESAFTGLDVTRDACPACRDQHHITADISFAMRQYLSATRDYDWIASEAICSMIKDIAYFWYSRAEWNSRKQKFDINGVMPPDQFHKIVNNSIFTNAAAAMTIHYARYAACLCKRDPDVEVPEEWLSVANGLHFEFNAPSQYHPEFEGYHNLSGNLQKVKQADVILLGYPLMWPMTAKVRQNDLEFYEKATSEKSPAMTWSMFAIGWLELGDYQKGEELFERSYRGYVQEPFKIWSEVAGGSGAVNFITGIGGFLQGVLMGYGGLRIRVERLEFNPALPPNTNTMKFVGLNFIGSEFDMEVSNDKVILTLTTRGSHELQVTTVSTNVVHPFISEGFPLEIGREEFFINATEATGCYIPTFIVDPEYKYGFNSKATDVNCSILILFLGYILDMAIRRILISI